MKQPPSFHKGQLVEATTDALTGRYRGTRPSTQTEFDDWYIRMHEVGPHDSAGEPWIHPGTTGITLHAGHVLIVEKGRCTARFGWHTVNACCEVLDPASGERFRIERRHLQPIGQKEKK